MLSLPRIEFVLLNGSVMGVLGCKMGVIYKWRLEKGAVVGGDLPIALCCRLSSVE